MLVSGEASLTAREARESMLAKVKIWPLLKREITYIEFI